MITKANVKDIYPLSPLQEGMLHHATVASDALAYCDQIWFDVDGPLDRERFAAAWETLVERHDILRTAFLHEKTKRPMQVALKRRPVPVTFEVVPPGETPDGYVARRKEEERSVGYDLGSDPLMRIVVIAVAPDRHTVLWNLHHIMMDGWGLSILQREFAHLYVTGDAASLAATVPYARYIEWIERQDADAARRYWGARLAGFDAPTPAPAPKRDGEGAYDLRTVAAAIPADVAAAAGKTAAALQVTMGVFLQTVWGVTVANFHHADDVVFGTVVSGRPATLTGADRMLGLFINAVPVRVDLSGAFADAAVRLQRDAVAAEAHHYLFLGEVQNQSPLRGRLVDHLFVYENYPAGASAQGAFGGLTLKGAGSFERTNYDLAVVAAPARGGGLPLAFHYNAVVYDEAAIADLADRFVAAFAAATADPHMPCAALDILPAAQRERALASSRGVVVDLPDVTVVDLIRRRAEERPAAAACVDAAGTMTYAELMAAADRLSRRLVAAGVAPGAPVAVVVPRSRRLPVAAVGVMGAGAVYLPLDPTWPPERIAGIVEESGCRVMVAEGEAPARVTVVGFDADPPDVPLPPPTPGDAAYAVYTSGSTGRPKGVVIGHRALLNLTLWHGRFYSLGPATTTTLFAVPSFDASIWEMIPALAAGGRLVVVPDAIRADAGKMTLFIVERGVTHTFTPPALTEAMLRDHEERLPPTLTIHTGGEALRFAGTGRIDLANNYGPSECCVAATALRLDGDGLRRTIPIGRPIDNANVYLLDKGGRPVPVGGTGEIVIGGVGVGEGYLNRPDLTAERFADDPFAPDGRVYKTGDRGRRDADGNIRFAGRIDEQVQVRGYRVEPMEVERRLAETPGVTASAVAVVDDNLTAFYTAADAIDDALFRAGLGRTLPDYMIPARFVRVEAIPTNGSGKIDRKALAPLAPARPATEYEAPTGERETAVADAWSAVLGKERIGRHDDFFALGGHSLKATQVASRLRNELGVEVDPSLLLRHPTVARLAAAIDDQKNETGPVIRRAVRIARK
jgi:amino acid adenylation domain-containing protein